MAERPRLKDKPQNLNEQIQDRTIRHLLYLTRLQSHEAKELVDDLDEMLPLILDKITQNSRQLEGGQAIMTSKTRQRLQALAREINLIVQQYVGSAAGSMKKRLTEFAEWETDYNKRLLQDAVPIEFNFTSPDLNGVREAVFSQAFNGEDFSGWFNRLEGTTKNNVMQAVREGVLAGENIREITKRVEGANGSFQRSRNAAERLARTAVIHAQSVAKESFYAANTDMIKAVQWVATLDTTTCPICGGRDTETFKVNEGPRPAAHPNCRCTTTPVTRSWQELGIDRNEISQQARESMDGEVPGKLSYNKWLKSQSNSIQNEALGQTKAKAFRKGSVDIKDFTNRRGRILNLDDLKAKGIL